jgi:hypothetical protein
MVLIERSQLQIGVQKDGVWTYHVVATDPTHEFAMACSRNPGCPVSLYTFKQDEVCTMITSQTLVINAFQLQETGIERDDIVAALRIANVYIKGVIRVGD